MDRNTALLMVMSLWIMLLSLCEISGIDRESCPRCPDPNINFLADPGNIRARLIPEGGFEVESVFAPSIHFATDFVQFLQADSEHTGDGSAGRPPALSD